MERIEKGASVRVNILNERGFKQSSYSAKVVKVEKHYFTISKPPNTEIRISTMKSGEKYPVFEVKNYRYRD